MAGSKRDFNRASFSAVLGIALVCFAGVGTHYIGTVFNHSTRYLALLLLLFFLAARRELGAGFGSLAGIAVMAYALWASATLLWSDVPAISGPKSALQIAVVLAFMSAGYQAASISRPFEFAFFLFLLLCATAALGLGFSDAVIDTGDARLYRGLAFNPNLLGIYALLAAPWVIWNAHRSLKLTLSSKLVALVLVGIVLMVSVATGARASLLSLGVLVCFYLMFAGFGRFVLAIALGGIVVVSLSLIIPDLGQRAMSLVMKGTLENSDLLYSRRETWGESEAAAEQGGLIGLGFGVSAGYTDFAGGLSTEGYGREKGNTALAVQEELGIIGFSLYISMLASITATLLFSALRATDRLRRTQLGLALGSIVGMTINSQFEAWFVAPASPAAPFFWTMVGFGLSLARRPTPRILQAKL